MTFPIVAPASTDERAIRDSILELLPGPSDTLYRRGLSLSEIGDKGFVKHLDLPWYLRRMLDDGEVEELEASPRLGVTFGKLFYRRTGVVAAIAPDDTNVGRWQENLYGEDLGAGVTAVEVKRDSDQEFIVLDHGVMADVAVLTTHTSVPPPGDWSLTLERRARTGERLYDDVATFTVRMS